MTATVSGIHLSGTHAARPAAAGPPAGTLYSCTSDNLIYRTDGTSWSTWATLGGVGGSVATDAIWDAAGDLAVGSGANTAARLAIGAAGGAVSRVNGAVAWNSGTSFPTAATGDRYWRTDIGLEFYYDGTRWVTTTQYTQAFGVTASISASGRPAFGVVHAGFDVYIDRFEWAAYVSTTNDGTNYWTAQLQYNVANTWTNLGSAASTVSLGADTWHKLGADIDAVVTAANADVFGALLTKVAAGGTLISIPSIYYRLVGV